MRNFLWGRKQKEQDLIAIERHLQAVLKPVKPRPEFVRDLRRQLVSQFSNLEPDPKTDTRQLLLVSAAGFLSGTLILVLGIRTVLTLLGALGVIHQFKRQLDEKRDNPLQPS
jgi:hypothetical protein